MDTQLVQIRLDKLGIQAHPKIKSIEDVMENPQLLADVKDPAAFETAVGEVPKNWKIDRMRHSRGDEKTSIY